LGGDFMTSGLFKRTQAAAPSAAAWIVAAILLILHGTAPGALQLQPVFELRDAAPAMSSGVREAHRGTLPRVQSRATSVEAGIPKAPQRRWNSGGKPLALPPTAPAVVIAKLDTGPPAVAHAAGPRVAARFFDPRGPPLATA
jgi:hypothetical protein